MTYPSIDKLQKTLADDVFSYATDSKKASGRALGTLVEIVTYYTLRSWGLRDHIAIERPLPEFANNEITHNVEFSLHPLLGKEKITLNQTALPITAAKLIKNSTFLSAMDKKNIATSAQVMSSSLVRRNSCLIAADEACLYIANVDTHTDKSHEITICKIHELPFAVFECKRVGVEEGMKKGPQTIEKAKQGAYVARTVSALQKIRSRAGEAIGYIERSDGTPIYAPLQELIQQVISGNDADLLSRFILTVGVVSNHGNWFTKDNQNKELKVLAQSYDWLLFLTDAGLSQFIDKLLLNPDPSLVAAKEAFLRSYSGKSGGNRFTKVKIDNAADTALQQYFETHKDQIESWYNVISPNSGDIKILRAELNMLCNKNWKEVHST